MLVKAVPEPVAIVSGFERLHVTLFVVEEPPSGVVTDCYRATHGLAVGEKEHVVGDTVRVEVVFC